MYQEAHKGIREDPWKKDDDEDEKKDKEYWKKESKKYRTPKLTKEQKQEKVQAKIAEVKEQL